jgi:hypothetical protein
MKTFSRDNLASADGMFVLNTGVALVIAVVFISSPYPKGRPTSSCLCTACHRERRRARASFSARTAHLAQSAWHPTRRHQHLSHRRPSGAVMGEALMR